MSIDAEEEVEEVFLKYKAAYPGVWFVFQIIWAVIFIFVFMAPILAFLAVVYTVLTPVSIVKLIFTRRWTSPGDIFRAILWSTNRNRLWSLAVQNELAKESVMPHKGKGSYVEPLIKVTNDKS